MAKFPSPSLTPPSLLNWQFSFQGYTFGASQPVGVLQIEGLGDVPTIRNGDMVRARDHGELVGLDLYGGRDVTIDFWAKTDGTSLQSALLSLSAALQVGLSTEQPLWFQQPNLPLLACMCRCRKKAVPWDVTYAAANVALPIAQFHATDPRLYTVGQTATVGLANPTSGMHFPATFPISFGSTGASGATVTNSGNVSMNPVVVITGPVTNPTVQNATISGTPALTISNPLQTSYTVLSGDQLVLDLDAHTIQYFSGGVNSGTAGASRMSWLVPGSTWWSLPPGNNLIQFLSQDSVQVAGTAQIQWASSYIL